MAWLLLLLLTMMIIMTHVEAHNLHNSHQQQIHLQSRQACAA
jgi:hypothetical protein